MRRSCFSQPFVSSSNGFLRHDQCVRARRRSLEITRENSGVKRGNYKTKVAVIHLSCLWLADRSLGFDDRLKPKEGQKELEHGSGTGPQISSTIGRNALSVGS